MNENITSTKPADLSSNTGIDWYGQSWVEKTFSHPENVVRVGTAFSGIGSPEMALEQLGVKHEVVFACDINKSAKKSYLANYPVKDWWDDVEKLNAKKYKGMIDLFVAGVCCQPWSLAGKLEGLKDKRGQLFYQFERVICECAPKVFIFENVDNILRHKTEVNGKEILSWSILIDDMETKFKKAGLHYHLHWRVLDSADYGIPQHRERVFCIGFLDETGDGKDDFLFPKWGEAKSIANHEQRMEFLEKAMLQDVPEMMQQHFIPHLQLHEFESLLFADITAFEKNFMSSEMDMKKLKRIVSEFPNPEEINNNPKTAPSKRLEDAIRGYQKVLFGNCVAMDIGINKMMASCPHFCKWINRLVTVVG